MGAPSRWLQWVPGGASAGGCKSTKSTKSTKSDETSRNQGNEATSGTSDTSVTGSMAFPSPNAWSEDFALWSLEKCAFCDRGFQSTSSLHVSFCDWAHKRNSVPCKRREFKKLLALEGFCEADGPVHGLMLVTDLKALSKGGGR
jgi:hypothetical protein